MNNETFLFVYGTLLRNQKNHFAQLLEKNSIKISEGFIFGKKYNLGKFPGVRLDSSKFHKTYGELLKITSNEKQVLSELDFYEGYNPIQKTGNLFIRKSTIVHFKNKTIEAFVYEYAK